MPLQGFGASQAGQRTVLCYGDSNTHGTMPMATREDIGRFGPDERWPGILAEALGPGWRVIEEGLPGRTTVHPDPISGAHKNGIAVLPAVLESHRPLDLVVIFLGTNDLKTRFAVPAVEIADSVELLVLTVLNSFSGPDGSAPNVLLIVPPPVLEAGCLAEIFEGGAAKSRKLATYYAEVAARQGVTLLDAGTVIVSCGLEGVHFEASEHRKLGHAVAEAILKMDISRQATAS